MPYDDPGFAPFGFAAPMVGAGGYGLPFMPPLPPRYQGEIRNPAARPADPVAEPVAQGLGPLGPFLPGAGRAAGAAGSNLLREYLPWMGAGAVAGGGGFAADYAAGGRPPQEGILPGMVFGAGVGALGRGVHGMLRRAPPSGAPAARGSWDKVIVIRNATAARGEWG